MSYAKINRYKRQKMNRKIGNLAVVALLTATCAIAQTDNQTVRDVLSKYFQNYTISAVKLDPCSLVGLSINDSLRTIDIVANEAFGEQPFSSAVTDRIYGDIRRNLPEPFNSYGLTVHVGQYAIGQLVPNIYAQRLDSSRMWNNADYRGAAWVSNASKPFAISKGLGDRHLTVWASHGRYYANELKRWTWQRPYLFCTNEDLLTQTIVVPYLIPMLENAGAIVYSPRERDWQMHEAVVDNDAPSTQGSYGETKGKIAWENCVEAGFANPDSVYYDGQNPFTMGTTRKILAVDDDKETSAATWTPEIPAEGRYAVYVSYKTLNRSISDARYSVCHKGQVTEFKVNQRMGGSTWVYLGTFSFDKGKSESNCVQLSNLSGESGIVTADAVRFGGGMGNIARGDSLSVARVSGLPRFLEGARYSAQWAGMPYSVYSSKNGINDYGDDINARSYSENHLGGGSVYSPDSAGMKVPFELSIALHSDAGADEKGFIGSLGICTTNFNGGLLSAGISRLASRDLCEQLLTDVTANMTTIYGSWNRRKLYNRNYSETRLPNVPSAILEMFSHQNFQDMKYAHDPNFKFNFARSVYKVLLKYVCGQHQCDYVVQPLPIKDFSTQLREKRSTVTLQWKPVADSLEPTASPTAFIVYTRIGDGDFDNGICVTGQTSYTRHISPGKIYSFRVTAVNDGGESFPSETLCAYMAPKSKNTLLIVNGFHRLSGPEVVENASQQGFDIKTDIGVPYMLTPEYAGLQQNFDVTQRGIEGPAGLGYSTHEMEGQLIAGNTFDYPFIHGKSIASVGNYSFVSCSSQCVENGSVNLNDYALVDLILGAEKDDKNSLVHYKTFSNTLQRAISSYCTRGGKIFVSGSYVASDMTTDNEKSFISDVLKYNLNGTSVTDSVTDVKSTSYDFTIYRKPNADSYAVQNTNSLSPTDGATTFLTYSMKENLPAAVAYKGSDYRTITMGFPFESIVSESARNKLMASILQYLTHR
jgi:hypothetical protein